jgi:hypothetical protein
VSVPPKSENGNFVGTWWYVNRDIRAALWLKSVDGEIAAKLQMLRFGSRESFITDWDGVASYDLRGGAGSFALSIDEGDANELRGSWAWELRFPDSSRSESSPVKLYRTGDGRRLVMHFPTLREVVVRPNKTADSTIEKVWTFRQASRRLLLWDELPF